MSDTPKSFDLSNLQQMDTADIEILHPTTGEKLGITITLSSMDSPKAKEVQRRQQNERINRLSKGGRRGVTIKAEEMERNALDLLVECTVGWSGVVEDGQPLPFSKENARKVYAAYPWLRQQVDEELGDRANFLGS